MAGGEKEERAAILPCAALTSYTGLELGSARFDLPRLAIWLHSPLRRRAAPHAAG